MNLKDDNEFKNFWVIITGGDRGIGRSIAYKFASHGANIVIIFKKNKLKTKKTIDTIRSMGVKVKAIKCDISDYNLVQKVFSGIVRDCGSVDILVNCAGIIQDNMIIKLKKKD